MKLMNPPGLLAAIVLSSAFAGSANAQTLQIDPIYVGGTATFEVQNGSPNIPAIICYSMGGSGPVSLGNGITLDLSMPVRSLNPFILDAFGNGTLGPFPVPSSAVVGMQVWFQGVLFDMWANPVYSVTNMVPITVQNNPPTAVDDIVTVGEFAAEIIDVMANDYDVDGDDISLSSVSTPLNGSASILLDLIVYTPSIGFSGSDYFTYTISDSWGLQSVATVFIDVEQKGLLSAWGQDWSNQVSGAPAYGFAQVSSGGYHSAAVHIDGSLVSWGNNVYGQVSDTPAGNSFTQVSAGKHFSVALRSDGTLSAWGQDGNSQVTGAPTGAQFAQVSAGGWHSVALRRNGSLVSWGADNGLQVTDTPTGYSYVQVSAGGNHSVALQNSGTLVSWGNDANSQVSSTPSGNDFVQISAGMSFSVALRSNGTLVSWGYDVDGQVSDTPIGNDFIQVSAGEYHCIALRSDGTLVSWGLDVDGQVSDTPYDNGFTQVSAGGVHSVALAYVPKGFVTKWGATAPALAENDYIKISHRSKWNEVALRADGSLEAYGGPLLFGNDFVDVSAGKGHGVALRSDGTLVSWGSDVDEWDNITGAVSDTPITNDFIKVEAGVYYSIALRSDGSLVAWGYDYGTPPTNVDIVDFSSSTFASYTDPAGCHSVALKSDGSLVSWGNNTYSQVSNTPSGNDFIQASAGGWHSVALRSDGTLVSWGLNGSGQVSDTPSGNDFIQVSGGGRHSAALRSDGTIVSWGWNYEGQVSDTPSGNDFIQVEAGEVSSVAISLSF